MPYLWEIGALVAAAVAALAWRRWGADRWRLPEGPATDWALAGLCALVAGIPLWRFWNQIAGHRAPAGADYEGYYLSALAIERSDYAMYALDRYPGYPWLTSLLSPGPLHIHTAGAVLNMAAMIAAGVALYWIGRQLAGRAAGVVGALLGLRLSLVLDLGHTFTHYPLAAALDAALVALLIAAARGKIWAAPAAGICGALAAACDPKQLVFVLVVFAGIGLALLLQGRARIGRRLAAGVAMIAPLEIANRAVMMMPVDLYSLEEVATRVHLRFQSDPSIAAHAETGFRLGEPTAWLKLPGSLWRTGTGVSPGAEQEGAISELALLAMPLVFGDTSRIWGVALVALAAGLLWRRPKGWWAGLLAMGLLAITAWPLFHLNYQHRYFLNVAIFLPALVAAGIALWGGGAAAAGAGLVALLLSPLQVDTDFFERQHHKTDLWVGPEKGVDLEILAWATETLPERTHAFDMAEFRAAPTLAAAFPYTRCNQHHDACAERMAAAHADGWTLIANVWTREHLSGRLPGGPGQPISGSDQPGGGVPDQFGSCWEQVRWITPDNALFRYTCDAAPRAAGGGPPPPPPPPLPDRG